ncbi:ankyrin repeat domain-containing protein 13c [Anaeramoeba flamelloides]|uniref:Ankyrin repeat domain-containing protein 13c n=1 Tax=Anaeramoeba flamelloides TaxID=1746091 RepID=A0AAV7YAK0_9EUKA|nr:ankyrin repeat domain-containing protein 13c [Anaeramoeba flamelloides]
MSNITNTTNKNEEEKEPKTNENNQEKQEQEQEKEKGSQTEDKLVLDVNKEFFEMTNNTQIKKLTTFLKENKDFNLEIRNKDGFTPLMIAIHQNNFDTVVLFLQHGADPYAETPDRWTSLQESAFFSDKQVFEKVFLSYQSKQTTNYKIKYPIVFKQLENLPDFTMKLKWEMSSWVPFLSSFLPNDEYLIRKKGTNLRLDCSLLGVENKNWIKGDVSILLSGSKTKTPGDIYILDHEKKTYFNTTVDLVKKSNRSKIEKDELKILIDANLEKTNLYTDNVIFERKKNWFGELKIAQIYQWECDVYQMKNMIFEDIQRKIPKNEEEGNEEENENENKNKNESKNENENENEKENENETEKEKEKTLKKLLRSEKDITKISKNYSGIVYCTTEFPLTIDDIMPILETLAPNSQQFDKLKEFISLQLPFKGFPVKMQVPIFPGISAVVTFTYFKEMECDDEIYVIPENYQEIDSYNLPIISRGQGEEIFEQTELMKKQAMESQEKKNNENSPSNENVINNEEVKLEEKVVNEKVKEEEETKEKEEVKEKKIEVKKEQI